MPTAEASPPGTGLLAMERTPPIAGSSASFAHTYAQPGTFTGNPACVYGTGMREYHAAYGNHFALAHCRFWLCKYLPGAKHAVYRYDQPERRKLLTQRAWNFGDPGSGILNTSTQTNPIHYLYQPGPYMVTLVTLNAGGCADTAAAKCNHHPQTRR